MNISSSVVVSVQPRGRSSTRMKKRLSEIEIAPSVASGRPSVGSRKVGTIGVVAVGAEYRGAPEH